MKNLNNRNEFPLKQKAMNLICPNIAVIIVMFHERDVTLLLSHLDNNVIHALDQKIISK